VLVSGSFHELLAPLARHLHADHVIATTIRRVNGRLTSTVQPMVGMAKRDAVRADCAASGVSLGHSWGYGDHQSDRDFLGLLAHQTLIQASP
jgi:phosphoserine phosphatase